MALLRVVGDVGAKRAPAVLASPCQERPSGIVGADCPLAKGDCRLLRLGGHAHKGVAQGEGRDPEVLFEKLEEPLVYAVVLGGAVRWWCARLLCGHLGHSPFWPGGPGLLWSAPGPRLCLSIRHYTTFDRQRRGKYRLLWYNSREMSKRCSGRSG